jgi:hypothetical protein
MAICELGNRVEQLPELIARYSRQLSRYEAKAREKEAAREGRIGLLLEQRQRLVQSHLPPVLVGIGGFCRLRLRRLGPRNQLRFTSRSISVTELFFTEQPPQKSRCSS